MGRCVCGLFCGVILGVASSFTIIYLKNEIWFLLFNVFCCFVPFVFHIATLGWSVVCNCCVLWSNSLAFEHNGI